MIKIVFISIIALCYFSVSKMKKMALCECTYICVNHLNYSNHFFKIQSLYFSI